MAEPAQYPIGVAALWGPEGETEPSPFVPAAELRPVDAVPANGNGESPPTVEKRTLDDVARLADAIAANHSHVLRKNDLDAMRQELEGAFTQQLAGALYELMGAWNARFATVEDHINQRMSASVEAQTGVLASSIEANFYAVLEIAETVRKDLGTFQDQLAGVEGLPSFQREIRHEVGRLADLITAPRPEVAERDQLAATLKLMRSDLAELREEISELRAATDSPPREV
ncbi:MAG: hypothetical protein ABR540_10675 [Acidimicrobiales bacterium]